MPQLFETTGIRTMELRNRFVRSATWMGMAGVDGSCTRRLAEATAEPAHGGVGLVISGLAYVSPEGQSAPYQLGAHSDGMLPGLTRMAEATHEAGGKIALQIAHAGLLAMPDLTGAEVIGPSETSSGDGSVGRPMTESEIRKVIDDFAAAAARGREAGFDAVQLHAAHGFLLSQFLSPCFNHREDAYGGSVENRARMLLETVAAVRKAVGKEYPLLVKMNANDRMEGGFDEEQMAAVAKLLEQAGVDAIELSGGTMQAYFTKDWPGFYSPPFKEGAYYLDGAKLYREAVDLPLMLVGGIRTLEESEGLVGEGITDYVSLCRPLIHEPGLVGRWKSGDTRPSECISDNGCFQPGIDGFGMHCVHFEGRRSHRGVLEFHSASSGDVNTRRAVAECFERALGEENTDCDLVIFHTTMGHNFDDIIDEMRRLAPSARLVGCTGAGVIGREGPNESMRALALMAIRGPKTAFAVVGKDSFGRDELYDVGVEIARELKRQNSGINMILCYPSHSVIPAVGAIEGIESVFGPDVPIVGGYSMDNNKLISSFQFVDDTTYEMGIVAVGFADPNLEVITEVHHGFRPASGDIFVTRSEGPRVYELDGEPAWKRLTELLGLPITSPQAAVVGLGELAEELPRELHEEYGSEYLIIGGALRQDDDSIVFTTTCPVGKKLRLLERDEQGIHDGVGRMTSRIGTRCAGRKPVAVFHADCSARGKLAFNRILKEELIDRLQRPICGGEDIPWLGMYGGAELCPLGGRNMIHSFTASVFVIVEREDT